MTPDAARRRHPGSGLKWALVAAILPAALAMALTTEAGSEAAVRLTELDAPSPTAREQAIVVLTGNVARVDAAAHVQRATGLPLAIVGAGTDEFIERADRLRARVQFLESHSLDTEENAAYGSCVLHAAGIRRVVLVTEPLHGRRATAWLRYYGIEPTLASPPRRQSTRPAGSRFLPSVRGWQRLQLALHEWAGLAEYGIKRTLSIRKGCGPGQGR